MLRVCKFSTLFPFFVTDYQDKEYSLARPRRMSELNVANKIIPIPPGSSFFIMSQTNRLKSQKLSFTSRDILECSAFLTSSPATFDHIPVYFEYHSCMYIIQCLWRYNYAVICLVFFGLSSRETRSLRPLLISNSVQLYFAISKK